MVHMTYTLATGASFEHLKERYEAHMVVERLTCDDAVQHRRTLVGSEPFSKCGPILDAKFEPETKPDHPRCESRRGPLGLPFASRIAYASRHQATKWLKAVVCSSG